MDNVAAEALRRLLADMRTTIQAAGDASSQPLRDVGGRLGDVDRTLAAADSEGAAVFSTEAAAASAGSDSPRTAFEKLRAEKMELARLGNPGRTLTPRTDADHLYRGDARPPSTILTAGFEPLVTSDDAADYVLTSRAKPYIYTTRSESLANIHPPTPHIPPDYDPTWIYEIDLPAAGIDLHPGDAAATVVFPHRIPAEHIKGGYLYDRMRRTRGEFVPNPGYRPSG
ncbi:hypothetical protein [Nocardia sp. alder85J]|uniref:scabin-related ADP-ribosyltransferase n=1 Tax=Nocardia sp. alder85J TaxID=2862949 RepID=UPI001CD811A4|nr:hypothetical protein [Nocardia sp. alder85J]MCX4097131.1 hypothetical protein [Nocardia sp. alder85J]